MKNLQIKDDGRLLVEYDLEGKDATFTAEVKIENLHAMSCDIPGQLVLKFDSPRVKVHQHLWKYRKFGSYMQRVCFKCGRNQIQPSGKTEFEDE